MTKTDVLRKLYYNKAGTPGAYQGVNRLFKAARKVNNDILYSDVLKFLQNEESYQLHYDDTNRKRHDPLKSKSKRQWIVGELGWIGLDTMYMAQGLGSPFPYLMIGVDLFSSKIYATFLKKLDGTTGLAAVKRILAQVEDIVGSCSDQGGEFSLVREHMRQEGNKYYVAPAQSPHKIAQAERAIRTIRTIAGRVLDSGETTSAMQAVKIAINSHNSSPTKRLGNLAPDDITKDKQGHVLSLRLKRRLELESKAPTPMAVGQLVRLRKTGTRFTKSNMPKYSRDVYKIDSLLPHSPTPGYRLRSVSTHSVLPGPFDYTQLLPI